MKCGLIAVAFASLLVAGCGILGNHKEKNPDDIEDKSIAPVSSGSCDGFTVIAPESLFAGPYQLAQNRPASGTAVAVDGVPDGLMICTALGCNSECCDNNCGYEPGCTYVLRVDSYNSVCLAHDDFKCGGTDCSPWCHPFSTEPKNTYRFVGTIRYDATRAFVDVTAFCRRN